MINMCRKGLPKRDKKFKFYAPFTILELLLLSKIQIFWYFWGNSIRFNNIQQNVQGENFYVIDNFLFLLVFQLIHYSQ